MAVVAVAAASVGREGGERLPKVVGIEGVDEPDRDRHLLRLASDQAVRRWSDYATRTMSGGDGCDRQKPSRTTC
jgi:hypothetical protein